jgi:hypothetical protein
MAGKHDQSPAERARISEEAIKHLKTLVKDLPVEVLGHVEAAALCCGSGTVALVKIDRGDPAPKS